MRRAGSAARSPSQKVIFAGWLKVIFAKWLTVIFAKWLNARCRILLIDEPTRGVDVGAKRESYQPLRDLAARRTAIVMVWSALTEVLGMSDPTVVTREARMVATLDADGATEERIIALATRVAA